MDIEAPRTGATVSTAMHTGASSLGGGGGIGGGTGGGGSLSDDDGNGGISLGRATTTTTSGGGSLPAPLPPLPPPPVKRPRIYEVWQGNERFFCWGRCMAGPNWRSCFGSAALILLPTAVLLAWVAPYMGRMVSWALLAISCVLPAASMAFLLLTACVDPGVLPRQAPDEEWLSGRKPRSKDVNVRGHRVTVRYNDTCHFFQPPRAHHCSVNDNCIQRFDHHCPWVGTTVGLRNYRSFLMFVYVTTAYVMWSFGLSLASLFVKRNELLAAAQQGAGAVAAMSAAAAAPAPGSGPSTPWVQALAQSPAAIALMVYCFIFFWFVGGLAGFHTYLTATNQTTYENFRYNQGHPRSSNPYDLGVFRNCASVWCSPIPAPRIRFRAFVDDESARPERVELSVPSWREPLPPAEEEEGDEGRWRAGGNGGVGVGGTGRRARGEVPPPPATHAVSATQHIYDPPEREHGFVSGSQGGDGVVVGGGAAGATTAAPVGAGAPMSPLAAGALAPPPLAPPPLALGKSQATTSSLATDGSVGGATAYLSTQGSLAGASSALGGGGGSLGGTGGGSVA
jgi:palmitoyltransferase ZDHHC9/14/18